MGNLGRKITIQNKKFNTLRDAARYHNIKPELFIGRLHSGWNINEAIALKKYSKIPTGNNQFNVGNKKFKSLKDASKYHNLSETMVRNRIHNGWSVEKTFNTKK